MSALAEAFRSPNDRRLRAGWRLLAHAALTLTLSVVFSLAVLLPMLALSVLDALGQQWLGAELGGPLGDLLLVGTRSATLLALSAAVSFPSFTLATWLARRWFDRRSFRSLGFQAGGHAVRDLLFGFGLPGLLFGLILAVEGSLGWVRVEGWLWQSRGVGWAAAVTVGSLAVFALVGFYEELVFRGYYLVNLTEGAGRRWAVALSSIAFALAHIGNPFASWVSTVGLVAAGLFLAYPALRTGRLWLPMGLHVGWNFFEGTVFGFPVSGTAAPALLLQHDAGPPVVTGGGFGPEAGLVVLPALLFGAALIHVFTRGRNAQASASPLAPPAATAS